MVEREMITMIVNTLPVFYYEKLVGYMPSSFTDLVFAGERIKVGLKRGKFDYVFPTGINNRRIGAVGAKRKEGDAYAITSTPAWPTKERMTNRLNSFVSLFSLSKRIQRTLPENSFDSSLSLKQKISKD